MKKPHISVPVPKDMAHHEWRRLICRTAIRANYRNSATFARRLGVARSYVDMVIGGFVSQARIEAALAELSGYPVDTLFPKKQAA